MRPGNPTPRFRVTPHSIGRVLKGTRWAAGVLVLTSTALACSEQARNRVESAGSGWEISAAAALSLGVREGDPDQTFGRIVGVELLSDGGVAVADGQAGDVRWFGPDGRLVARAGGLGDGPGEFRRIGSTQRLAGDTIVVFDAGTRRLTTFDSRGALVRTVSLLGEAAATAYQLEDGRIIAMGPIQPTWGDVPRTGLRREPVRISWYGPDGGKLRADTTYPGADIYVIWTSDPAGRTLGLAPFGRWTTLSADGSRYIVATGDSDSLEVVDAIRGDRRALVLPLRDRRITAEMAKHFQDSRGSASPNFPLPDLYPPYSRVLLVDDELWVSSYPHSPASETEWFVFDLETDLPQSVLAPAGLDVRAIRGDRVAGVRTDALGVEKVAVHVLRRGRDVP